MFFALPPQLSNVPLVSYGLVTGTVELTNEQVVRIFFPQTHSHWHSSWLHNRFLVRELNPSKSYHPSRILVVALHTDQSSLCFSPLKGIYKQPFANTLLNSGFFASLSKSVNDTWEEKHQENVKEFFKQSLENNIAKPVVRMLRYLTTCFYACYILETIYN